LSDFRWRTLRVTARDQNPAARIGALEATDQLPDVGIRPGGDGASVQNRHLACANVLYLPEARLQQLPLDRSTVRLARAATEIEKLECGHGRNIIVADLNGFSGNLLELRIRTQLILSLPGWKCLRWN
jgi:hypothetical protein